MKYLNISGYCFKKLDDLNSIKTELSSFGKSLGIKGTILVSPEGLNVFLSGTETEVNSVLSKMFELTQTTFDQYDIKPSYSDDIAFNRFLVKIKKEIIAFDSLYNFDHRAPYISAQELEDLLDKNDEEVILIDTRNDYEVMLGTFKNAIDPNIKSFKEFKKILPALNEHKKKKIVTFCTGGIRCEKAAVYMKEQGFENVYQLRGGILKYFEDTKSNNYDGECFVFDKRVSLKPNLDVSDKRMCFVCRMPLTAADLDSHQYVEGKYCPHCYEGVAHAS